MNTPHTDTYQPSEFVTYLSRGLQAINAHVTAQGGDEWDCRLAIAHGCGYYDARHMVHMLETFGMAPIDYVLAAHKHGDVMDIPWMMLEFELLRIGKRQSSVDSALTELRSMALRS